MSWDIIDTIKYLVSLVVIETIFLGFYSYILQELSLILNQSIISGFSDVKPLILIIPILVIIGYIIYHSKVKF